MSAATVQATAKLRSTKARAVFTTSRELDFWTESALTTQIGYPTRLWPVVVTKELIDNPHVTFTFNEVRHTATAPGWRKWRTDEPTSPHWYLPDDMRNLIAAHIRERDLPLRDFVAQFDGLKRNRSRADVLSQAKLKGTHLSDLVKGDDVDMLAVTRLLEAMRANSRPVHPRRLGVIGQDHLQRTVEALGGNNFTYVKKVNFDADGLPVVVEIGFAIKKDAAERSRRIIGLNWSPTFKVPSREVGEAINGCQVSASDPVILVLHAARPRFAFADQGKGALT
jgi:hypothetical protein